LIQKQFIFPRKSCLSTIGQFQFITQVLLSLSGLHPKYRVPRHWQTWQAMARVGEVLSLGIGPFKLQFLRECGGLDVFHGGITEAVWKLDSFCLFSQTQQESSSGEPWVVFMDA
jgi:hypothetical protein